MKTNWKRLTKLTLTFTVMMILTAGLISAKERLSVDLNISRGDSDIVRFEGDPIPLTLTVDAECFVTVVALDIRGNVRVIYPHENDYCNRLLRGRYRIEYERDLMASAPGPVLLYAFASNNKNFRFHFTDSPVPFLDRGPFDRTPGDQLFLIRPERDYPISLPYRIPRPVRNISRWEADELADELQDRIYDDYDEFGRVADQFLSWMYSRTRGMHARNYGSDYLDLYVAPWHYSPDSYRVTGHGYDRPVQFDPFTAYGEWIRIGNLRVWSPTVWSGWYPFSNGYWTWTRHGWTWISHEPWGSITDHYGYWAWHHRHGWIWVPGYDWFPAPVSWFVNRSFYAWYPRTPPRNVRNLLGRECRFGDDLPAFSKIPKTHFLKSDLGKHQKDQGIQAFSKSGDKFKSMKSGPSRGEIERSAGKKIPTTTLNQGQSLTVEKGKKGLTPFNDANKKGPSPELKRKLKSNAPVQDKKHPVKQPRKSGVKKPKPKDGKLYKIPNPDLDSLLKQKSSSDDQ